MSSLPQERIFRERRFESCDLPLESQPLCVRDITDGDKSAARFIIALLDGKHVVTASEQGRIQVLASDSDRFTPRCTAYHGGGIVGLAALDSSVFATAGKGDLCVRVWCAVTGAEIELLKCTTPLVCMVDTCINWLAIGFEDGSVAFVKHAFGGFLTRWTLVDDGHENSVEHMAAHGDVLVSADKGGVVRVWSVSRKAKLGVLPGSSSDTLGSVGVNSRYIVLGRWDGEVLVHSLGSGFGLLYSIRGLHDGSTHLAALLEQNVLITSSTDGIVSFLNLEEAGGDPVARVDVGYSVWRLSILHGCRIAAVSFSGAISTFVAPVNVASIVLKHNKPPAGPTQS